MGELVTLLRRPLSPVGRLSQRHSLSCPSVLPASAPGALRETPSLHPGSRQLPGGASYPGFTKL